MAKPITVIAVAAVAAAFIVGCGKPAEETKTPAAVEKAPTAAAEEVKAPVEEAKEEAPAAEEVKAPVEEAKEEAPAAEEVKAPAEEAKAPAQGTIRMITEATFPPYEYREGTTVVGIDVEICKAIAKELGKELAIEDVEFDSVLPSLEAGKAELAAAGITVTEDRKKKVDFSDPYVRTGIVIISAKANPIETAEAAKGKKIGVQNGTTSADFCVKDLGLEPDRFDSPASAVAALKAGKVDLVIADIDPAKAAVKDETDYAVTSDFLSAEEYAVAIKKGQPELLKVVNKVINELKDSGKLDEIIDEHKAKSAKLAD